MTERTMFLIFEAPAKAWRQIKYRDERQRSIPWCKTHDAQVPTDPEWWKWCWRSDKEDLDPGEPGECEIVEGLVWEVIDE